MNCARREVRRLLSAIVVVAALGLAPVQPPPYKNASLPVDARVKDLLGQMTLEEKFWQLFMIPEDLDNPANDSGRSWSWRGFSASRSRPASRKTSASLLDRRSCGCWERTCAG